MTHSFKILKKLIAVKIEKYLKQSQRFGNNKKANIFNTDLLKNYITKRTLLIKMK